MIQKTEMTSGNRHLLHPVRLLAAMAALLGLLAWLLAGYSGFKLALLSGIIALLLTPKPPAHLIMRTHGALGVSPEQMPQMQNVIRILSRRAGFKHPPKLYYKPTRQPNAFAAGDKADSAICITGGLLRLLTLEETAGIVAHEMSHIKNNDMQVMGISHLLLRLIFCLSLLGQVFFFLQFPEMTMEAVPINILTMLLLIAAPGLSSLMHFALSRSREFEADLGSALLTGNPRYLASALKKMEKIQDTPWTLFLKHRLGYRRNSLLMRHPSIKERIQRLLSRVSPLHSAIPV